MCGWRDGVQKKEGEIRGGIDIVKKRSARKKELMARKKK